MWTAETHPSSSGLDIVKTEENREFGGCLINNFLRHCFIFGEIVNVNRILPPEQS
jgi:hypothetical protein